jgi:hypothetical protein
MDLKTIMNTTPEALAKLQYKELKSFVLERLNEIVQLIKDDKYEKLDEFLFNSPAGDGYGMDNMCINFSYDALENRVDISEIVEKLTYLKSIMNRKSK